ncbi:MAG: hypothetical protein PHV77_02580 [Candidatus Omnitrophica bacterium]|nr:hypothetical protein [Candidatus Omnitrophota bacterium]
MRHPERQKAKHASVAKDLGVTRASSRAAEGEASVIRLSSRAAEGEARVVSEGSGSEVSIRFLASLGMTAKILAMTSKTV